ncbi:MAG TPA: O-antigen ligase family protein [Sedimentisphaerales bacterium]|nr:O-antigen ligase family protein [Sedimentisphaerales bacterium]HRS10265.1 O-antigen ligase family protein [Sedimentisphaerales bacterium]HRV46971.1 O-antigen ligase family protein [Sedimentisphaerales bacterium]
MSIRLTALYLMVAGLSIYAWKDWFKSLCGLILLMAVIEHGDMPRTILGIQGLNPWNVLFSAIFLAWLASRRSEGLTWDMPQHLSVLLAVFLGVIVFGVVRAALDLDRIPGYTAGDLLSEELVNTIKWVMPSLLLFDGCRTRKRVIIAFTCLLVMYCLIAVQVVKRMPLQAAFSESSATIMHARRRLNEGVGYHATDLSVMLGGACWGLVAALPLAPKRLHKVVVAAAAGMVAFGQVLTGGRAGYVAWGATGLVLCLLKWRKYLILAPIVVLSLPVVFPGATARMLEGFGQTDVTGETAVDEFAVTSGRNLIWPHVVEKIKDSPWIGHGRRAMQRTGLQKALLDQYGSGEAVAHPHNLYLETLLDNGILGSIPIWLFYALLVVYAAGLFRSTNRLYSAVGGLAVALMLTSLIGGLSGQHYFPQEHTLGIWAAVFISLRVHLEEKRARVDADMCGDLLGPHAVLLGRSDPVTHASRFQKVPE